MIMLRFLGWFLFLQLVLFSLEMLQPIQHAFVLPWTSWIAQFSSFLLSSFDATIHSSGKVISSTVNDFAISIEPGCNGVEAMIVLAAAIIAFPTGWLYKLKGLMWGTLAIQALNLVRIISLFYLGQWNRDIFDWAHLYIWQALIMVDALVVFLIWMRYLPVSSAPKQVSA